MADALPIGGLYRFFDDHRQEWIECPLAVDLAATIAKLDAAMAQREQRRKKREVVFTDVGPRKRRGDDHQGLNPDDLVDGSRVRNHAPRSTANPWQGDYYLFRILVGIGTPWPGPPRKGKPCPCCAGIELAPIACCVYCDRTGVDLNLPKPTPAELRARSRPPRKGEPAIAGGIGPAKPAVAPVAKVARPAKAKTKKSKPKHRKAPAVKAPKSGWRAELDAMKAQTKRR